MEKLLKSALAAALMASGLAGCAPSAVTSSLHYTSAQQHQRIAVPLEYDVSGSRVIRLARADTRGLLPASLIPAPADFWCRYRCSAKPPNGGC